jgi:hypothetical protein
VLICAAPLSFSIVTRKEISMTRLGSILLTLCLLGLIAGCASVAPPAYRGLTSAPQLRPTGAPHVPLEFRHASADLRAFSKLIIDPVTTYDGGDAQFGGVSPEDRKIIAEYMQQTFAEVLGEKHEIVQTQARSSARIRLTLTGIEANTPVLSTVTRLIPIGLAINAGAQAAGQQGAFMGSVSYAVEVFDASTGDLVYAYVTRQAPAALDITSSVGLLDAAKTGVRAGAQRLRDELLADPNAKAERTKAPRG